MNTDDSNPPAPKKPIPVVYACSGCSDAGEIADRVARQLTREGVAQMSCLAGIGGRVKSLVSTANAPSRKPSARVGKCTRDEAMVFVDLTPASQRLFSRQIKPCRQRLELYDALSGVNRAVTCLILYSLHCNEEHSNTELGLRINISCCILRSV